ncbi:MAG: S41 family peptidase [Syntrophothermus sp.]
MLRKYWKLLFGFFLVVLFTGFYANKDIYFEISKNIDLFGKVYKEVTLNYVDEIDLEEFMKTGIQGMLNSLDPYTVFIDDSKKDEIELITNGKYAGVGISVAVRGDKVIISEVFDGYAAQKQGIHTGDVLVGVSDVAISPNNYEQISSLIKGEPGTTVDMTVVRNNEQDTINFNIVREEISVKNLAYYGFYPKNSNNVYLKLIGFSRSAGEEVRQALKELESQKRIESIVLDLRNNPGGLLDAAVQICEKFLDKDQIIVSTRGRDASKEKRYYSDENPIMSREKLVVLVNDGSASASEIVAGAIQDHDRGLIIGTKTFGKGLVQTISNLGYNTQLKITTAKYYTPSGRCIQKIDYSSRNHVISKADTIVAARFLTDNSREVFSAGGITPDSTIEFETESGLTQELFAQGMFFRFADYYTANNEDIKLSSLNNDELISEFQKFLSKEKFVYKSDAEKEIDKLYDEAKNKKLSADVFIDLNRIKTQFGSLNNNEIKIYRDEILSEIRSEIALKINGFNGKTEELLNGDKQFQAAFSIASNNELFKKLLNSK